jgi:Ca2+-binding RTX toxin-like protein
MARALVSSVLTAAQIAELRVLRDAAAAGDQSITGKWRPVYDELYSFIGGDTGPVTGVDHNVWLWLRGARFVNSDEGPFAALIREYTNVQHKLRYGVAMSNVELNIASNGIAAGFIAEWIPYNPADAANALVPDIKTTGATDAGPVAAQIFNKDLATGDYAPWAGTFLFANLGEPAFYRDWVLKALDNPNTRADSGKTLESGGYDIISIAQGIQDLSTWALASGLTSISAMLDAGCTAHQLSQYNSVRDALALEANAKFRLAYGLIATDPDIKIGSDTFGYLNVATNVGKSANYAVGTTGNDIIGLNAAPNGSRVTNVPGSTDVVNAGRGNDTIQGSSGRDMIDGGEGTDTLRYSELDNSLAFKATVSFAGGGVFGWRAQIDKSFALASGPVTRDLAYNIERIELDRYADRVNLDDAGRTALANASTNKPNLTVDGGSGAIADTLNFSTLSTAANIGRAADGSQAVEVFGRHDASAPIGRKFVDPTGLRFTNFEQVIGTSGDDRMVLDLLTPGGALTAAEKTALDNILNQTRSAPANDPNAVNAMFQSVWTQAKAVAPGKLDTTVLIDGGNGNDWISAPTQGNVTINGGIGDDRLYGAGITSILNGGEGNDILFGGGALKSVLTGGSNADIFVVGRNSTVTDATREDYVLWDGGYLLTGGVQQSWMEGGWAYSASAYNTLASITPGIGQNALSLGLITTGTLLTTDLGLFRYGVTQSGQLIVQMAGGKGQAVIEGYARPNTGIEDGAVGNITTLRLVNVDKASFSEIKATIRAILASSGLTSSGTDPLVLDLDGDGVELVRLEQSSTYFDLDNDNFAERTAWVRPDDGLLVRDLNNNGKIDNVTELFGNATTPGFTALKTLDSNNDNLITSADAAFGTLRVWRDLDQDGVTDAGELQTLAQAGITSISAVGGTPTNAEIRGTTIRAESTFTLTNGTTRKIVDAVFDVDQGDTLFLGNTSVSTAAAALPNLKGIGNTTDLRVAITVDATLQGLVTSFKGLAANSSWATLRDAADNILFRWAGVDGVAATAMTSAFDRQKLAFLEKIAGQDLVRRDAGIPDRTAAPELAASWNAFLDKATARLAMQGPMKSLFNGISYDTATDQFKAATTTALANVFGAAFQALSTTASTAQTQWATIYAPVLTAVANDTIRSDGNVVLTDFVVQSIITGLEGRTSALSLGQIITGLALPNVLVGTAGNETLTRSAPRDAMQVFVGGGGSDTLQGGVGQDVYVFGSNFGQDTVIDVDNRFASGDRIRFATLNSDQVTIRRQGNDLVITVNGTTDRVTVKDMYEPVVRDLGGSPLSADKVIEEIQFKDGKILEAIDIAALVGRGTDQADNLTGSSRKDMLEGLKGNDTLSGGDDGDTYLYSLGDGADIINDNPVTATVKASDALIFLSGIREEDLRFSRVGSSDDVTISFATAPGSVTIKNQFSYSGTGIGTMFDLDSRIEVFMLADGGSFDWLTLQSMVLNSAITPGDDLTYGFGLWDNFSASAGNDTLIGGDGGDVYRFGRGSGNDLIHDQQKLVNLPFFNGVIGASFDDDDWLIFGSDIRPEDVTFKRLGAAEDLEITLAGSTDRLVIKGQFDGQPADLYGFFPDLWFDRIEKFKFADGTVRTWEDVIKTVTKGTAADDVLYGALYKDTLDGGLGNDFLSGGDDNDLYIYARGYGHDTVHDQMNNFLTGSTDTLKFLDINRSEATFTRNGRSSDLEIAFSGTTTDKVTIKGYFNVFDTILFGVNGVSRIEVLQWQNGQTTTWNQVVADYIARAKTTGADTIYGAYFGDTIDGGLGNDFLSGGDGSDTYLINLGDEVDTISDEQESIFSGWDDKVVFGAGLDPNTVRVDRFNTFGWDARLSFGSTGQSVTFDGLFSYSTIQFNPNLIERFEFANGTVWTPNDLKLRYIAQQTTAGADVIEGFEGTDIIVGGTGNDTLRGGDGSDVYRFSAGFGQDIIEETVLIVTYADRDVIEFGAGISAATTQIARIGSADMRITFSGSSDSILVKGQFARAAWFAPASDIEEIKFADGTIWTDQQIRERLLTAGKTAGSDTIQGFHTDDLMDGGAGNDILRGGEGGDVYLFGPGLGNDTIEESFTTIYGDFPDTVRFAAGVTQAQITFSRVGNDLRITSSTFPDVLLIKGHFLADRQGTVELFEFSNGTKLTAEQIEAGALASQSTPGNDTIAGTTGANILDGGAGNDVLQGGRGADTYIFGRGYGSDRVDEQSNPTGSTEDKIQFRADVKPSDVTLSRVGNDLLLKIIGTTDELRIVNQFWDRDSTSVYGQYRIEFFSFADGTTWTADQIDDRVLRQQQTSGADTITGYESADTIDGGAGNDVLQGGKGADTYVFGRGYGSDRINEQSNPTGSNEDRVQFKSDITPGDVVLSRVGDDLLLRISGATDELRIVGQFLYRDSSSPYGQNRIEFFNFADGTIWSANQIDERVLREQKTAGADTVTAYETDDRLDGGAGNDLLRGGKGADTYVFGRGYGQDIIEENSNPYGSLSDRVVFDATIAVSDVSFQRAGADLVILIAGGSDRLTVKNHYMFGDIDSASNSGQNRVEFFVFSDGTELTATDADRKAFLALTTSGADTITGFNVADQLDGAGGNDLLRGTTGADTYVFGQGYGQDVIDEQGSADMEDRVVFNPDIQLSDILASRVGDDLLLRVAGSTATLRITRQFEYDAAISERFSGTSRIESFVFADGTIITGEAMNVKALTDQQTAGNDVIRGYTTHDVIRGQAGNDSLFGQAGNDTLVGGLGSDTLDGGTGSDIYVYVAGDGADKIDESNGSIDNVDRLRLLNLNSADVTLSKVGNDLMVRVNANNETLEIDEHFYSTTANWGVEELEFANGAIWNLARINAVASNAAIILGTANADTLTGGTGADGLFGEAGNDQLIGNAGNDFLSGDGGNDTINGGAGSDLIFGGDGNDTVTLSTSVTGELDIIDGGAGTDTLNMSAFGFATWIDLSTSGAEVYTKDTASLVSGSWRIIAEAASIENVIGTAFADELYGTAESNSLSGGASADRLEGRDGDDILIGGAGADILIGGAGVDTASYAGAATLTLDRVTAANSTGDASGDTFTGIERFLLTANADRFVGNSDNEFVSGGSGNDTLLGGAGSDTLNGDAGNDSLDGGAGTDALSGGVGDDALSGASGDDTLSGGAGNDSLVFASGFGKDIVSDFAAGTGVGDVIEFQGLGTAFDTFAEILAVSAQIGANTVITIDVANTITLQNVARTTLVADDFRFS